MGAPGRPGVLVREEGEPSGPCGRDQPAERRLFIGPAGEILVAVLDRLLVPFANPAWVRVGQVDGAVGGKRHQRVRIVHHRRPPLAARDVIVLDPEGVAHLVGGQLANPRQRHLLGRDRSLVSLDERYQEALGDQIVLTNPERAQRDVPLDDFARPGIGHRGPVAPAASGSVDPLDHVVPDVHRVGAFGQQLDPERVLVPRRLEGLVPPSGPVQQRRADRLGRPTVEIVDDRLDRLAHRRGGVLLLESMAGDEPLDDRLRERRGVVVVAHAEEPGSRIRNPGTVAWLGQGHERVMLPDRDGVRCRRDIPDPSAGVVGGEGQGGFDFAVSRESLGPRQEQRAPGRVELEGPLPGAAHRADHVAPVPQDEVGAVHQHGAVALGLDFETPDDRLGEGLFHRPPLIGVVADGAKAVVRLDHQEPRTDPVEPNDLFAPQLAPIKPDIVRADTRRHRHEVQQFLAQAADFEPDPALARIPIHRDEAVDPLHSARLVGHRGHRGLGCHGEQHGDQRIMNGHRDAPA